MVTIRGRGWRVLAPPSMAMPRVLAFFTTWTRVGAGGGSGEQACWDTTVHLLSALESNYQPVKQSAKLGSKARLWGRLGGLGLAWGPHWSQGSWSGYVGPGVVRLAPLVSAGTRAAVLDEAPRLGDVHPAVLAQSLAAV